MGLYLNPGNESFRQNLNSKIYVDKTMLIAYTNSVIRTEQKYVCVSRPRRFGKSTAANMLTAYYTRGCDSKALFVGLKIAEDESFKRHLNQYNVIHINMQNFLGDAKNMDQMLQYLEEDLTEELETAFPDVKMPRRKTLPKVFSAVFSYTQLPFVFIIDEWDCVFRVHRDNTEAQKQYLDFLRGLLKDQIYVALAYMTGILPVKKYGEHSAINVFYEYSMTYAKPLQEFVGFTETEVQALCNKYSMPFETMKQWYDGYWVDGISVYNPKSVVEAILRGDFNNYWTQTETYEALKLYIQMDFDGLRSNIIRMVGGGRVTVNPAKFQNDMTTFQSADDVLTLLVHLGYLTYDSSKKQVWIPNGEIQQEFVSCIEDGGWETVMSAIRESEELLNATIEGNEQIVAKMVESVHESNTSILEYNDENSLACVLSLAYYSARKEYRIYREMPAGKGFADMIFLPVRNSRKPAMVVELKWKQSAETALDQIGKKKYVDALQGYSGEILLVGICYNKDKMHECRIVRMSK